MSASTAGATRARRIRVLGWAALAFGTGCSDAAPRNAVPPASPAPLAALRAIGYADLADEPADARAGVGLHDVARVAPGLVAVADEVDSVRLLDNAGSTIHAWTIPGRDQVELGTVLPNGDCLAVSVDQGLTLVDRDSRELWRLDGNMHHEAAALGDGSFATLAWDELEFRGRRVRFDRLLLVSAQGCVQREWSTYAQRASLRALHAPQALDEPATADAPAAIYDYYHLNSVFELPDTELGRAEPRFRPGNLLIGARNVGLFFVLDRDTLELVWHLAPAVDFPHTPTLTAAGTLLVFDNGWHRGFSRLQEFDPLTGARLWSWAAPEGTTFFTKRRGSCQRLANGNTLVCESEQGHLFELEPGGELVWDFWNPDLVSGHRRRIYRAHRYTRAQLPFLAELR